MTTTFFPANSLNKLNFEDIYREYYKTVLRTCLGLIKNYAEAEDITQEVFLQIQRNLHNFRGEASLASWIYRIAVNQVYMHWRKKSVRCEVTTLGDSPAEDASPVNATSEGLNNAEKITLLNAIEKLPKGMRSVLTLHDIYGYNHEEVGKLLGIDVGTSKSQLHKARLKVRDIMQHN